RTYLALELMDRGSLAETIAGNPLPPKQAAELLELLARAVQVAHGAGILHRDLKPANVLLASTGPDTPAPSPTFPVLGIQRISDVGLAKRMDQDGGQTRTGSVLGTPSYMAPEQAMGQTKQVGPAADVYALGAILYECLTGRPPFQDPTMMETIDLVR